MTRDQAGVYMCEAQNRHGQYNHYDQSIMIRLLWSVQLFERYKWLNTHKHIILHQLGSLWLIHEISNTVQNNRVSQSVKKMWAALLGCKIQAKHILMCCPAILPLHAKAKNLSSPPYTRTGDLYLAIYTRLNCCWRRPSRHIHRENRCKLTM